MKTLKEAKIERFGHRDKYENVSTYFQITYIWEYKFLGISFQKEEKLPILFENESDTTDFIECGCNVEMHIEESLAGTLLYTLYVYKIDNPNKKYKIRVVGPIIGYGYKALFIVTGYSQEKTCVFSNGAKISDFFKKIKRYEELEAQQKEKERKDKEYVESLYEVKTYKIERI